MVKTVILPKAVKLLPEDQKVKENLAARHSPGCSLTDIKKMVIGESKVYYTGCLAEGRRYNTALDKIATYLFENSTSFGGLKDFELYQKRCGAFNHQYWARCIGLRRRGVEKINKPKEK